MKDATLFADLDRLIEEGEIKPLQEDEFTIRMLMDRSGKTWGVMNDMVHQWLRAGKVIETGYRKVDGKRMRAFRLVEEVNEKKKRGGRSGLSGQSGRGDERMIEYI